MLFEERDEVCRILEAELPRDLLRRGVAVGRHMADRALVTNRSFFQGFEDFIPRDRSPLSFEQPQIQGRSDAKSRWPVI